jgi:hypothetical protein
VLVVYASKDNDTIYFFEKKTLLHFDSEPLLNKLTRNTRFTFTNKIFSLFN